VDEGDDESFTITLFMQCLSFVLVTKEKTWRYSPELRYIKAVADQHHTEV